jgi:hypothetical protein
VESGIVAVEWPDRWRNPPAGAREIRIEHRGETSRRITVIQPDSSALPS